MPHLIHLHGPWDVAKFNESGSRFLFKRRFGCPTNLEPSEKVFLACELNEPLTRIVLNGESISENVSPCQVTRIEITAKLKQRNELTFEIADQDRNCADLWQANSAAQLSPGSSPVPNNVSPRRVHWGIDCAVTGNVRLEIEAN